MSLVIVVGVHQDLGLGFVQQVVPGRLMLELVVSIMQNFLETFPLLGGLLALEHGHRTSPTGL